MHETTKRDAPPALSKATPAQLVQTLSHPNGWRRDTAQRLLVERGGTARRACAQAAGRDGRRSRATRLHALWTLDGIDAIDAALVTKALGDASRDVRASAVRLAERFLDTPAHPLQAGILARIDDPDWWVREQLAASLGALPAGQRETALAALLSKHAADPIVMDAALSGVRGSETALLEKLLQGSGGAAQAVDTGTRGGHHHGGVADRTRRAGRARTELVRVDRRRGAPGLAAIGDVARRGGRVERVRRADAGQSRTPRWWRGDACSGAPPQAPAVAPPCPTCPGGRAGPGGAYAFAQVPQAPGAGRGRGGGAALRVSREPVTLSALASGTGEFAPRATALLARVEWPGKPGAAAPIAPLTPAEQQLFTAGQEVYKNVCIACHQPDGRGMDRIAPTLIGSVLALAPAEVTSRILLNGKEGPVGLMPPVGGTLSDDQIAGVLTYVRREWGQGGTAVSPETVKAVRAPDGRPHSAVDQRRTAEDDPRRWGGRAVDLTHAATERRLTHLSHGGHGVGTEGTAPTGEALRARRHSTKVHTPLTRAQ